MFPFLEIEQLNFFPIYNTLIIFNKIITKLDTKFYK